MRRYPLEPCVYTQREITPRNLLNRPPNLPFSFLIQFPETMWKGIFNTGVPIAHSPLRQSWIPNITRNSLRKVTICICVVKLNHRLFTRATCFTELVRVLVKVITSKNLSAYSPVYFGLEGLGIAKFPSQKILWLKSASALREKKTGFIKQFLYFLAAPSLCLFSKLFFFLQSIKESISGVKLSSIGLV